MEWDGVILCLVESVRSIPVFYLAGVIKLNVMDGVLPLLAVGPT
jgi:hypothetical protein